MKSSMLTNILLCFSGSPENSVIIRPMEEKDLSKAAEVHSKALPRQTYSLEWISSSYRSSPRCLCYVAEKDQQISGYILWLQKSGFRADAVIELEQIAVDPQLQGQGIGTALIKDSIVDVGKVISVFGSAIKHVIVTTRADNQAQRLYKSTLGAEIEATISNLFSADEVYMVARHVQT